MHLFYVALYIFLTLALSVEKNSTVIKIIRADVLPRFAEFLSRHGLPQLQVCSLLLLPSFSFFLYSRVVNLVYFSQMEAAWVLTNIAASDYTLLVAECGAVPRLVELLGSLNANIRHQVKQLH
jgi:importin subunit alpha-6/7